MGIKIMKEMKKWNDLSKFMHFIASNFSRDLVKTYLEEIPLKIVLGTNIY